jgi:hypothetical protein
MLASLTLLKLLNPLTELADPRELSVLSELIVLALLIVESILSTVLSFAP